MPDQATVKNRLLRSLAPGDFARIANGLVPFEAGLREVLIRPDARITKSYFLDSGIASVVAHTADGSQTEVAIIGREGMVDVATLMGADTTELETFIQVPGHGNVLPKAVLEQAMRESETLRAVMLSFARLLMVQVSHTALASASYTLDARLARWLLMCHDRVDGDAIPMTHEFLSLMLSVRRSGVTVALQALEALGLIRPSRGLVTIRDRQGLRALAGDAYGEPEAAYASTFGLEPA